MEKSDNKQEIAQHITYFYEDEYRKFREKIAELGKGASLRKVSRALVMLWVAGEIELTRQDILAITPDTRLKK